MSDMPEEMEGEGEDLPPDPSITPQMFAEWRKPRLGRTNPEQLNNPVWEWLIRSRVSAYRANEYFKGPPAFEVGPGWCFDRFGQSTTVLPDGRTIFIAGEHEDHYDPDFYIYNDVVVRSPGGDLTIFGYPRDVFPPTDFHSATLAGDRIVVIGNLGYPAHRQPDFTPVFLLDLHTFAIRRVETSGPFPGWLHSHSATLTEGGGSVFVQGGLVDRGGESRSRVENIDDWQLHLDTWRWEQLSTRDWPRWEISREDDRTLHLFEIEMAAWNARYPSLSSSSFETQEYQPQDFDLQRRLYRPECSHEPLPERDDEFKVHRIAVNGVTVRYIEDTACIRLIVEGQLPSATLETLADDLVRKLGRLERTAIRLRRL